LKGVLAFGVRDPDAELDEDKGGVAVDEGESPCERGDMRTAIKEIQQVRVSKGIDEWRRALRTLFN
jgi:hypothetical protein